MFCPNCNQKIINFSLLQFLYIHTILCPACKTNLFLDKKGYFYLRTGAIVTIISAIIVSSFFMNYVVVLILIGFYATIYLAAKEGKLSKD